MPEYRHKGHGQSTIAKRSENIARDRAPFQSREAPVLTAFV